MLFCVKLYFRRVVGQVGIKSRPLVRGEARDRPRAPREAARNGRFLLVSFRAVRVDGLLTPLENQSNETFKLTQHLSSSSGSV